jgi:chromate transporter
MGIHGQTGENRAGTLWRLFFEFFKIALFVVGGGYAIIVVADDVFGRRLKWVEEGELIERLPVFQMVPGLIAGNTAIYVGLKMAGMLGAAVALVAVALPSILIFLLVACGYNSLPLGNPWLESAFLGLRSSLTGVIAGTVVAGWRKSVRGAYGYAAVVLGTVALAGGFANTVEVLMAAAAAGLALELLGLMRAADVSCGVAIDHVWTRRGFFLPLAVLAALFAVSYLYGPLFWIFVKFGLMCFGGGFVLVPAYMDEFVGPGAPLLQLPVEEFSNLMALTQMTPGPVAVNAATFFGYRLGGVGGAVVATAGLLFPGYFLLSGALTSLDKWKSSRIVRGLLRGIRPATVALMLSALVVFGGMSVWNYSSEAGLTFSPTAIILAVFSAVVILRRKLSVMATIFLCALAGLVAHAIVNFW